MTHQHNQICPAARYSRIPDTHLNSAPAYHSKHNFSLNKTRPLSCIWLICRCVPNSTGPNTSSPSQVSLSRLPRNLTVSVWPFLKSMPTITVLRRMPRLGLYGRISTPLSPPAAPSAVPGAQEVLRNSSRAAAVPRGDAQRAGTQQRSPQRTRVTSTEARDPELGSAQSLCALPSGSRG